MIVFDRSLCNNLEVAQTKEWLVSNGIDIHFSLIGGLVTPLSRKVKFISKDSNRKGILFYRLQDLFNQLRF